jgi:hypothetical protein
MRLWLGIMLISAVFTLFFLQQGRENGVYLFPALLGLLFIYFCWRKIDLPGLARAEELGRL